MQQLFFHQSKLIHTYAFMEYIKEKPQDPLQYIQSYLLFAIVPAQLKCELIYG